MGLIVVDQFAATSVAPMPNMVNLTLSASPQHLLSLGSVHINSSNAELAAAGLTFLRKIAVAKEYAGTCGIILLA